MKEVSMLRRCFIVFLIPLITSSAFALELKFVDLGPESTRCGEVSQIQLTAEIQTSIGPFCRSYFEDSAAVIQDVEYRIDGGKWHRVSANVSKSTCPSDCSPQPCPRSYTVSASIPVSSLAPGRHTIYLRATEIAPRYRFTRTISSSFIIPEKDECWVRDVVLPSTYVHNIHPIVTSQNIYILTKINQRRSVLFTFRRDGSFVAQRSFSFNFGFFEGNVLTPYYDDALIVDSVPTIRISAFDGGRLQWSQSASYSNIDVWFDLLNVSDVSVQGKYLLIYGTCSIYLGDPFVAEEGCLMLLNKRTLSGNFYLFSMYSILTDVIVMNDIILVAGSTIGDESIYGITAADFDGNILWTKEVRITSDQYPCNEANLPRIERMDEYVYFLYTSSTKCYGSSYLSKLTLDGNIVKSRTFDEFFSEIFRDRNHLILYSTSSSSSHIMKIDSSLNAQWIKTVQLGNSGRIRSIDRVGSGYIITVLTWESSSGHHISLLRTNSRFELPHSCTIDIQTTPPFTQDGAPQLTAVEPPEESALHGQVSFETTTLPEHDELLDAQTSLVCTSVE